MRLEHANITVQNIDRSVEFYRARLQAQQVEIHFEPTYDPGRRIYFYDPDGVEIELVSY